MTKLINHEFLTTDAADYFRRLQEDIQQAKSSIECESYILENDPVGNEIVDALCKACERGIIVRLMVDGFGSSPWIQAVISKLTWHGGQVRVYHPMPWHFWQWGLAINQQSFLKKFIFLFNVINRRNHRKICIIDASIHWLGSFNLTSVHLRKELGGENWRDTAIRIETSNPEARTAFNRIWQHKHFKPKHLPTDFPGFFRINDSRKKRRLLYRDLLSRITRSSTCIRLTTPYFIPEPRLIKRLKNAAQRGVKVQLLLPGVSDVFFIPWASSLLYRELIEAGVEIYEYQAGILHAKTLLVDNWATVGSSNMNSRSIFHDLEIDYVLQNRESVCTLENHFIDDLKQSKAVCLADIQKRNLIIKLLGRIALYLRYWM